MKNILLICSGGMSTSLLVTKMEKVAVEQGIEATIWAVGLGTYKNHVPKADVVLLGPQIRYMKDEIKKIAGDIPLEVIDMKVYGKIDGSGALKQALDML